ncbi:hypothetical protein AKJ62_01405 [candidate division MSBL1 archaeon SCGC-AAA259D14]|uniref:Uncharacterized protein n=1 Tax=candidate division MSBL1 archaeon SCGC-AAA259D14 TaxID=1698261 RepID=A0A133U7Q8_9EURY|nr:hypothetical protein AKJ62_01405 [candidate division MSBL1 archaeon SCGC-AAA259D14]
MSEISSYQKRFLSLYKRLTGAVSWQWFVEGLGNDMLVGGGSGLLRVIMGEPQNTTGSANDTRKAWVGS